MKIEFEIEARATERSKNGKRKVNKLLMEAIISAFQELATKLNKGEKAEIECTYSSHGTYANNTIYPDIRCHSWDYDLRFFIDTKGKYNDLDEVE